jgi:hypothetical protein
MIHVAFVTPSIDGDPALDDEPQRFWRAWLSKAQRASEKYRDKVLAGEEPEFDSAVWKELKDWLFDGPFNGKCGYCESSVIAVAYGDAEHYRPKGAVTDGPSDARAPVIVRRKVHEGYWWLAYDWTNLFPACGRCNSAHKREHFPTKNTHVRPLKRDAVNWTTAELDRDEEPLLLHPMREGAAHDPQRHITFDVTGRALALDGSARGQATIDTCGLNRNSGRNSLVEARRRQVDLARIVALKHFEQKNYSITALKEWLAEYEAEGGTYVGAVRCEIGRLFDRWRAELSTL